MNSTNIETADARFESLAAEMGYDFSGEIKIGGNYVPVLRDGHQLWVSGQIPRVGDKVLFVGTVGESLDLQQARQAAALCVMRALAFLKRALGTLEDVEAILRITVFVRSAPTFTQQSEVSDGASEVLFRVIGQRGIHSRTSVGVVALPKGASVELDLVASGR